MMGCAYVVMDDQVGHSSALQPQYWMIIGLEILTLASIAS
jgi:hypothetical protein